MMRGDDQISRAINELTALLLAFLPPPAPPTPPRRMAARRLPPPPPPPSLTQASPAAVASLLLGVSMALMFCGSVTFVIGFMLMPWVLGLLMVLYFLGIVSNLSGMGRAILCSAALNPSPASTPPRVASKDAQQGQFLSKLSTD